jgi:Domain of unknown function (DUF4326)
VPERIQLRRTKGWRKPVDVVVVARPSRWGNPHRPVAATAEAHGAAVAAYRDDLLNGDLPFTTDDVRRALRGRDLACWCRPELPCHADVLLEVANRDEAVGQ